MANQMEMVNGVLQPMSDADQAAYDAKQAAWTTAAQSRMLADLATHRYAVENGGTIVGGNSYKTDPDSRLALTAIFVIASSNPSFTANWKMANGTFVSLNATQIIASATAVLAFVQKCFDTEKNLVTNAANYSHSADIIAAFDTGMAS